MPDEIAETEPSGVSPSRILLASLIDEGYPQNAPLAAKYRKSFAFKTIGHRLPVILTKVIDQLSRDKNEIGEELGDNARDEVKVVVGALAKLKNEMQTNKTITSVKHPCWNNYISLVSKLYFQGSLEDVKWYFAPWLFVECYMYQRLDEAFKSTQFLQTYDPFRKQKECGWLESVKAAMTLVHFLNSAQAQPDSETLQKFLEISLWGNKCDLSISGGEGNSQSANVLDQLVELKKYILCDNSEKFWTTLNTAKSSGNKDTSIGYILDNAGFELFTDLCFADILLSQVDRVDFHVKVIPWFVSDARVVDFHWLLDSMQASNDIELVKLAEKWKNHLSSGKWTVIENRFWTYPHGFHEMESEDPKLYSQLAENTHLIFKGDLNYRKLIGDINWPADTPFQESLRGFAPSPLMALRTLKADCVSGLQQGVAEKIAECNPEWMITGEYAVIQWAT